MPARYTDSGEMFSGVQFGEARVQDVVMQFGKHLKCNCITCTQKAQHEIKKKSVKRIKHDPKNAHRMCL
mgnify:CR=1 FL=1